MRSVERINLLLALLAVSGCDCEGQLGRLAPVLRVVEPASIQGDQYVLDFGTVPLTAVVEKQIVLANDGDIAGHLTSLAFRDPAEPAFSFVEPPETPAEVVPSGTLAVR